MPQSNKLVEQTRHQITVGHAGFGNHGAGVGSVNLSVHDGDTIICRALGNISVRFLGVDTPEVSYRLPGETAFRSIGSQPWQTFLANPAAAWPEMDQKLGAGLSAHLAPKLNAQTATNHAAHAEAAHRGLERLVQDDVNQHANGDHANFRLFLRYARETMDRYGRLLAYMDVDLTETAHANPRFSYNERILQLGLATPYFIWPNLDPFKKQPDLMAAVRTPVQMFDDANSGRLGMARGWVRQARAAGKGVFGPLPEGVAPLMLYPFELRFLADRRAPNRSVIDLSGTHGNRLVKPVDYRTIPNAEDRLFVPDEYLPLFKEKGWQT